MKRRILKKIIMIISVLAMTSVLAFGAQGRAIYVTDDVYGCGGNIDCTVKNLLAKYSAVNCIKGDCVHCKPDCINDVVRILKSVKIKTSETKPAETKPAETKPAETKPAETKPAETKPAETKPAETKPAETKPAETKPAETKPAETKPAETKPAETKPAETKPAETKPAETKPAESVPTETASVSEYEKEVVRLVNEIRKQYGLRELTINEKLCDLARMKSLDMKEKRYFAHQSPTYGSAFDMMKRAGISYRTAGENIAMGYGTPQAVVNAWMNSEGHRANILNSSFSQIGVGYVANGNYWTQMFIG